MWPSSRTAIGLLRTLESEISKVPATLEQHIAVRVNRTNAGPETLASFPADGVFPGELDLRGRLRGSYPISAVARDASGNVAKSTALNVIVGEPVPIFRLHVNIQTCCWNDPTPPVKFLFWDYRTDYQAALFGKHSRGTSPKTSPCTEFIHPNAATKTDCFYRVLKVAVIWPPGESW